MVTLEPHTRLNRELSEAGGTHLEISTTLQHMGIKRSEMSVRRFCAQHGLKQKGHVSDRDLERAVHGSL